MGIDDNRRPREAGIRIEPAGRASCCGCLRLDELFDLRTSSGLSPAVAG